MNQSEAIISRTMDLVDTVDFEVLPDDDATHIGVVAWSVVAQPPADTETAVLLLRFAYQLGREQGRREATDALLR